MCSQHRLQPSLNLAHGSVSLLSYILATVQVRLDTTTIKQNMLFFQSHFQNLTGGRGAFLNTFTKEQNQTHKQKNPKTKQPNKPKLPSHPPQKNPTNQLTNNKNHAHTKKTQPQKTQTNHPPPNQTNNSWGKMQTIYPDNSFLHKESTSITAALLSAPK